MKAIYFDTMLIGFIILTVSIYVPQRLKEIKEKHNAKVRR